MDLSVTSQLTCGDSERFQCILRMFRILKRGAHTRSTASLDGVALSGAAYDRASVHPASSGHDELVSHLG